MRANNLFVGSAILFAVAATVAIAAGQSSSPNSPSVSSAAAQQQSPESPPPQQAPKPGSVLQIKTRLVTVDVVATDSHGNVVRDLKPDARAPGIDSRHTNCCVRYSSGMGGANDMIFIAYNLLGARPEQLAYGHIWASVYQSFSRGRLRITSRDPEADPEIRLQMLSDPRDLNRMRDAMRRLIEIANHPAIRAIASAVGLGRDGQTPAGPSAAPPSDEWMLEHCFDVQHAAGTCRMGAVSDERSVVDPRCRVIGVEGLRVIDASIIPEMIRANTHLTCVMIGEHLAAQIRAGG